MPFELHPANCEKCGKALEVGYQDRRHASMAMHLRVLLATGLLLTVVALPVLVVVAVWLMGGISDGWNFFGRDKRLVNGLVGLCTIPFSLLPGFLSWRYAFRQPKRIPLPCRKCGWVQICAIQEAAVQAEPEHMVADGQGEIVPRGAVLIADSLADRRVRSRERRRKEAAKAAGEMEPNPELDFSKPEGIQSEPLPDDPPPSSAEGSSDRIKPT